MGLFINSHLQALNVHKRLTELEKLSEISTGILALKNMVDAGDNLQDRQGALENLSRILPLLSATQRQYVIDEIFTPLLNNSDTLNDLNIESHEVDDIESEQLADGALSDYEMEFQLKLSKAHFLDVKELNRQQRNVRQKQEKKRVAEEQEKASQEILEANRQEMTKSLEARWADFQSRTDVNIHKSKSELKSILFQYGMGLVKDHPIIKEAQRELRMYL
jgi:uncharacterized protein (DUF1800 family)